MNTSIPVQTIYEDDKVLVIDKPDGLLVHPTAANEPHTLIEYIVRHIPNINQLSWPDPTRPGLVHRLDKNTSGLMVIAKTPTVLSHLQAQFKQKGSGGESSAAPAVTKEYLALVFGQPSTPTGVIKAAVGRHPTRDQQTVVPIVTSATKGKVRMAVTEYAICQLYRYKKQPLTLLKAMPQTGRLHQIRVHFKYIGLPIIGDALYFTKPSRRLSRELGLNRQFLHASQLSFTHPQTGKRLTFSSPLPNDLQVVLAQLQPENN